jgi:hypothetical protein
MERHFKALVLCPKRVPASKKAQGRPGDFLHDPKIGQKSLPQTYGIRRYEHARSAREWEGFAAEGV